MNFDPSQFTIRPLRLEDAPAAVDLFNAHSQSLVGINSEDVEDCLAGWQTPGFSLEEDTLYVLNAAGQPVGYAEIWDIAEPHVRMWSFIAPHPDYAAGGLCEFLAGWLVQRGKSGLGKAPVDSRVALLANIHIEDAHTAAALERNGFERIRASFEMRIELDRPLSYPQPIDGILIRKMDPEREFEQVVQVQRESFRDHWGFVEEPIENVITRWRHWVETDPLFDPQYWYVAMDGDEIAGIALCAERNPEDDNLAWVNILGVRRNWRKRGVGLALLQYVFAEFQGLGKARVGLGVDAQSLTGATRLYERAGMHLHRRYDTYEHVLREGVDLTTRELETAEA